MCDGLSVEVVACGTWWLLEEGGVEDGLKAYRQIARLRQPLGS